MTDQTAVDRIPIARSVVYAVRGLPDVPNQYGPGVLVPGEITLTYRGAPDSQLGRVHAYVAGRIWVDGKETPLLPGGLYGQHYFDGLDGWPEWLAGEARLHDPDAAAAPAGQAPATDRVALRDRIAEALLDHLSRTADIRTGRNGQPAFMPEIDDPERMRITDAVLAELPAPADRAAVLREEAALIRAHCPDHLDADSAEGSWMDCHCPVADDIERRLAATLPAVEAQQPTRRNIQCPDAFWRPRPHAPHDWQQGPDTQPVHCRGVVEAQQPKEARS